MNLFSLVFGRHLRLCKMVPCEMRGLYARRPATPPSFPGNHGCRVFTYHTLWKQLDIHHTNSISLSRS